MYEPTDSNQAQSEADIRPSTTCKYIRSSDDPKNTETGTGENGTSIGPKHASEVGSPNSGRKRTE